jgi:hypothetical protein
MTRISDQLGTDGRWAWRNLRARGWRASFAIVLLAVALAANAIVFSVADSIVFHRIPYPEADRLVEIQRRDPRSGRGDSLMSADLLDQWRQQTDLFSGVHGSLTKSLFLAGNGEPEIVATADVTVGMFELLGARPYWGRSFAPGDERQLDLQPVIIAEALARTRFGDPTAAVGKRIETTGEPLLVVGVAPTSFQFPDGAIRIWRPLDPRGPLTRNFAGVFSIARIAPGVSPELLARTMEQRSAQIGTAAGARGAYVAQPGPLRGTLLPAEQRRLFLTLLGAAACLLLIACANVASLELASAVHRARTYAIQLAVGASTAALARTALLEGLVLIGAAVGCATGLAYLASGALVTVFPSFLTRGSVNPIDVDERTLLFMAGAAAIVWLLSSLPVVVYASRGSLLDLLKIEGHAVAASGRTGLVRRGLTVAEVALAVMLLAGSLVTFAVIWRSSHSTRDSTPVAWSPSGSRFHRSRTRRLQRSGHWRGTRSSDCARALALSRRRSRRLPHPWAPTIPSGSSSSTIARPSNSRSRSRSWTWNLTTFRFYGFPSVRAAPSKPSSPPRMSSSARRSPGSTFPAETRSATAIGVTPRRSGEKSSAWPATSVPRTIPLAPRARRHFRPTCRANLRHLHQRPQLADSRVAGASASSR